MDICVKSFERASRRVCRAGVRGRGEGVREKRGESGAFQPCVLRFSERSYRCRDEKNTGERVGARESGQTGEGGLDTAKKKGEPSSEFERRQSLLCDGESPFSPSAAFVVGSFQFFPQFFVCVFFFCFFKEKAVFRRKQ